MTKILVIGFGGHFLKNILPTFLRMGNVVIEAVLVRDVSKYYELGKSHGLKVAELSYLEESLASWVYIATPISTHGELILNALESGKNVICEKPLVTDVVKANELFDIAEKKGLKLFEVCMYPHHKQFHHLEEVLSNNNQKVIRTRFTIPSLPDDNIRYDIDLEGGALNDVGYYPISIAVRLLGNPSSVSGDLFYLDEKKVDLFGYAVLNYSNSYVLCEWGIGAPYSNEIEIETEKSTFSYKRIFSKPETLNVNCSVTEGFTTKQIDVGCDDQFSNLFSDIFSGKLNYFSEKEVCLKVLDLMGRIRNKVSINE